jgi:2',3'-cyclic-nucleotide 2'-phosphodiesterase/3'-nucleotidase
VTFKSAPGKLALASAAGLNGITAINNDDGSGKGLADYAIDLSQ